MIMRILRTLLNFGFMIISILMAITDYCHITGNYRGSAHRDCNTKVKLN